ncbi:unnamed protein product [Ostreobium quekettii]|uniref:Uncharacterized protein n=1 Tax=Ostreobium quekettii TaxID=121088 RepID=A0A8S1J5W7_9CHLO|nr:unnamed protein product [Ostreobium quekettii]|eukprot:evm.model.scf_92.7 EVM.evm.TU.scf_92.7   scf_92:86144-93613(+)
MRPPDFWAWLTVRPGSRGHSAQRHPFRPRLQFFLGSTAVALTAVLISMFVGVFQTQSPMSVGASAGGLAPHQEGSWPCYMAAERRTRALRYKITKDACVMKYTFIVNIVDAIKRVHMCTGVVFGPRTVLAPAYCVDKTVNPAADAFPLVRISSYHLNGTVNKEGEQGVEVLVPTCRRILHSDFTGNPSHGRDIALLILQRAICCHMSPIRSIPIGRCKDDNLATFGWFADDNGLRSSHLEVLLNQWPMDCDACKAQLKELPEGVLCTARGPWGTAHV